MGIDSDDPPAFCEGLYGASLSAYTGRPGKNQRVAVHLWYADNEHWRSLASFSADYLDDILTLLHEVRANLDHTCNNDTRNKSGWRFK